MDRITLTTIILEQDVERARERMEDALNATNGEVTPAAQAAINRYDLAYEDLMRFRSGLGGI